MKEKDNEVYNLIMSDYVNGKEPSVVFGVKYYLSKKERIEMMIPYLLDDIYDTHVSKDNKLVANTIIESIIKE